MLSLVRTLLTNGYVFINNAHDQANALTAQRGAAVILDRAMAGSYKSLFTNTTILYRPKSEATSRRSTCQNARERVFVREP